MNKKETVTITLDDISACGAYTTTVTIDSMRFCSTCPLYEQKQKQNTGPKPPEDIENIDILYLEYSSDKSVKHFVFKYNGHKFRIAKSMGLHVRYTLSRMTSSGEWEKLKESDFCDTRSFYELVKYVKAVY